MVPSFLVIVVARSVDTLISFRGCGGALVYRVRRTVKPAEDHRGG